MKIGDLVRFAGSFGPRRGPEVLPQTGVILEVWTNGRTGQIQSADVLWDDGMQGNSLTHVLRVINESR